MTKKKEYTYTWKEKGSWSMDPADNSYITAIRDAVFNNFADADVIEVIPRGGICRDRVFILTRTEVKPPPPEPVPAEPVIWFSSKYGSSGWKLSNLSVPSARSKGDAINYEALMLLPPNTLVKYDTFAYVKSIEKPIDNPWD